jgi:polygalacturonase
MVIKLPAWVFHHTLKNNFIMTKQHITIIAFLIYSFLSIKASVYNIKDLGAPSDTSIISTQYIQNAINQCHEKGGGMVVIPAGDFKTGTLVLKSNVILFLEPGATLWGSKNLADYQDLKPGFISLRTQTATKQLIYAENADNIGITGYGTINGQGKGFKKISWNDEGITRPHLIRFIKCSNIIIENISLTNSGCWMQHYLACSFLKIKNVKVYNHNNFNNDGLDLDGCKNVTVSDFVSDSDDDGITLKSTSDEKCENIAISNCVVSSHCNAIKLGTETNGGFKNISISNCVIKPSAKNDTVFFGKLNGESALSLEIVDGGIMENIQVNGLNIEGTESPLFIRLGNRARPFKQGTTIDYIGNIRDIQISNVLIKNTSYYGCSITGLPEHPVENIKLSNIKFQQTGGVDLSKISTDIPEKPKDYPEATMFNTLPAYGFYIRHAQNITIENSDFCFENNDTRPVIYMDDVNEALIFGNQFKSCTETPNITVLKNSGNIKILNCIVNGGGKNFIRTKNTGTSGISILNNYLPDVKKIYQTQNKNEKIKIGNNLQ